MNEYEFTKLSKAFKDSSKPFFVLEVNTIITPVFPASIYANA